MSSAKLRPTFARLHAVTLAISTTAEQLADALAEADAFPERRRLAEGAVYVAACRRYQLATGRVWRAERVAAGSTTWGQSDHTYRLRSRPDGSYDARCSCGAACVVFTERDGQAWHDAHTAV